MNRTAAASRRAASDRPEQVWQQLAPLLCAPGRRTLRIYETSTGKFSATARLTARLPSRPAALPLYGRDGRTRVLALDFDASRGGADAADADLRTAAEWITRCGGVVITDRSPGGRHLWTPLGIGTTASSTEMTHLVRLLAARLPTLDLSPVTNPATGCLTAPGTVTKDGRGHRHLDGSLADAIEACTTRSHPALLARLAELLGAATRPRPTPPHTATPATGEPDTDIDRYCVDDGDDRRLAPAWVRSDPIPADITAYAERGEMAAGQRHWKSPSEARMSVLTAAVARGHSLASIRRLAAPGGAWHHGLGAAYDRYRHHADTALARDVHRALTWWCHNPLKHRHPQHKSKNSQGGNTPQGARGPDDLRRWLAGALAWTDREFAGKRLRWTVHALLQSLAWHAHQAGEPINGVWVVAVGGRSLSLGSGLLSEDAMWRVLRDLRDRPGSPLILTRPGVGVEADTYALTTPAGIEVSPAWVERVRIEPVHDAWAVLGHHLRRLYELVAYHGITARSEVYAAARLSESAGDAAVTTLHIAGLLTRTGRGTVAAGPVSLDTIAAAHHTDDTRAERITRFAAERASWRAWLHARDTAREAAALDILAAADPYQDSDIQRSFWTSAMDHGPPAAEGSAHDDEHHALELIAEVLGGRILAPH